MIDFDIHLQTCHKTVIRNHVRDISHILSRNLSFICLFKCRSAFLFVYSPFKICQFQLTYSLKTRKYFYNIYGHRQYFDKVYILSFVFLFVFSFSFLYVVHTLSLCFFFYISSFPVLVMYALCF